MKLSRLIYEIVTEAITLPVHTTYNNFIQGDYEYDSQFALQSAHALGAANLAFGRLYNYDKLPHFIMEKDVEKGATSVKIDRVGEVINVLGVYHRGNTKPIAWRYAGDGTLLIIESYVPVKVLIEYKKKFPHFTEEDIIKQEVVDGNAVQTSSTDVELEDYGVDDMSASYVKEFAIAQINEAVEPEIANNHNNRAEQYFRGIPKAPELFAQTEIIGVDYLL